LSLRTRLLLALRRSPTSTLCPYTTLFRSPRPWRRCAGPGGAGTAARATLGTGCGKPLSSPAQAVAGIAEIRPGANSAAGFRHPRSEEHTSELQSRENLVCRLLLEKKKTAA